MVCFRHPDATEIAARTELFTLAESLGGVESLIEVPQAMTHQSVEGLRRRGPADLVRLPCGDRGSVDDLGADLRAGVVRRPLRAGWRSSSRARKRCVSARPAR